MHTTILAAYFATALLAFAVPGPATLLALNNGSLHGFRRAVPGFIGAIAADLVIVTAIAAGLGKLMSGSPAVFSAVKWAGAAYLFYVGWNLLRAGPATIQQRDAASPADAGLRAAGRLTSRTFLVGISNPKAILFMSAVLPQFVSAAQPLLPQYLLLATMQVAARMLILTLYSGSAPAWAGR